MSKDTVDVETTRQEVLTALDEWARRQKLRSDETAYHQRIDALVAWARENVQPRPGVTLTEALEALGRFLLTDPTLPED